MIQWDMLKKPAPEQTAFEMVTLNCLVPKDHLLRKIDAVIDFSFIHDRVAGLDCADHGRPPLEPTCMFKALFLGYLFGVRSERQLVREIGVNVANRWFLRIKLTDSVFDASTLSQNRRRAKHPVRAIPLVEKSPEREAQNGKTRRKKTTGLSAVWGGTGCRLSFSL